MMDELRSLNSTSTWNLSLVPAEGSGVLGVLVSTVYSVVCAAGLLGNLLVFYLMSAHRDRRTSSSITLFVLNLAVTDLQFVLTLPFWAVDVARDYSWPFGTVMCKIVLSVTVMNMYASVFFLTAMSVTRYRSVACAPGDRSRWRACSLRWVIVGLWLSAAAASLPTSIFSKVRIVTGERLCLMGFPDERWLVLLHLQKLLVGFLLPLLVVTVCYMLLLRAVRLRSISNKQLERRSRLVTRSVTIVVLSFFICWLPNQAITFWGVLVKLNVASWDNTFYMVQTYAHPVTVCLAQTNSCLNPVLYCLVRREFRNKIKTLFWRVSSATGRKPSSLRPFSGTVKTEPEDIVIPLNNVETETFRLSALTDHCETDASRR